MNKYYCFLAGLPEISFDDGKLSYSLSDFIADLDSSLSASDRKLMRLFRLKYDNQNLLTYLNNKEATLNPLGNYTAKQFEQAILSIREEDPFPKKELPTYLLKYLKEYVNEELAGKGLSNEDYLSSLYYDYASTTSNRFVREWFNLNLNIGNILSAFAARKMGWDLDKVVVGNNDVAKIIRANNARDLGLTDELDYFETLVRLSEEKNLFESERKVDLLKWDWLEEKTLFIYFSFENVFSYLLKLEMIERWLQLNKETGEQMFRSLITQMKESVKLSEEFYQ
ncbi:DUF2764 domain-containing protein [Porphyromonadaceae bacterium]